MERLTPQERERDRGYRKHDRSHNGDPVEIALDHVGSREAAAHASSEHVRQPTTTSGVKQDEEYEAERHERVKRSDNR